MAPSGERMHGPCIVELLRARAGIRADLHGRAAVAEVPGLSGRNCPGRSHGKGDGITGPDVQAGMVGRVNPGGGLVAASPLDDIDDGKIVIDAPIPIGHLEDLAETSRAVVLAFHPWSDRRRAVAEAPLVPTDLARGAPRTGTVEGHGFAGPCHEVWPRHGDDGRLVLAPIGLPQE